MIETSISDRSITAENAAAIPVICAAYKMVEEFHLTYGHPVRLPAVTSDLLKLRGRLICEEARHEGLAALEKRDLNGFLDALADSLYVEMGSLVVVDKGLECAIAGTSNERLKWSDHTPEQHPETAMQKAMMFAGWVGDGFEQTAEISGQTQREDALSGLCLRIFRSLIMKQRICAALGINLLALLRVVHESNMTKLWPADDWQLQSAIAASKYHGNDLAFRPCDSRPGLVGYRKSDGKILKSPTYTEVDLSAFVTVAQTSELWRVFLKQREKSYSC